MLISLGKPSIHYGLDAVQPCAFCRGGSRLQPCGISPGLLKIMCEFCVHASTDLKASAQLAAITEGQVLCGVNSNQAVTGQIDPM